MIRYTTPPESVILDARRPVCQVLVSLPDHSVRIPARRRLSYLSSGGESFRERSTSKATDESSAQRRCSLLLGTVDTLHHSCSEKHRANPDHAIQGDKQVTQTIVLRPCIEYQMRQCSPLKSWSKASANCAPNLYGVPDLL